MPLADRSIITDEERLQALKQLCLLDTPAEPAFDRLTSLACRILKAPVSLVTLVDRDRQFFKSQVGLSEPYASRRETPLSHSFCQHAVALREPLIVADARQHPLVFDNLAIPDLDVIAYAGIPLVTTDGQVVGSFCVIDSQPHEWTAEEVDILSDLAASVMTEMELRGEIEARKQLQETLAEQEHFVRQIVNTVPAVISVYDFGQQHFTFVNEKAQWFLGYPAAYLHQPGLDYIDELIHPEDVPHVKQMWCDLYHSDGDSGVHEPVVELEYRIRHQDSTWRWFQSYTTVFSRDEDGTPQQALSVTQDVTRRRAVEQQVFDLSLQQEQAHLLQTFVEHTSHDLRTPLTLIQTRLDLARRATDEQTRSRRLDSIQEHIGQMVEILDGMVAMAHLNHEQRLEAVETDVNRTLREAVLLMTGRAARANQTRFSYQYADHLPPIQADPFKLRQAFAAVLDNAIRHTPADSRITIWTAHQDDHVVVGIADTGPGIPPEDIDRIFDHFYKGDKARTQDGSSRSGLGLSITRKIVELHHGRIELNSRPGEGTTFRLLFPAAADDRVEMQA